MRADLVLDFTANVFPATILFYIVFNVRTGEKPSLEVVSRLMQMFWEFVRAPESG